LHLKSSCSISCVTPPAHFILFILEMESHELLAQTDLEPQSSPSQSPKCELPAPSRCIRSQLSASAEGSRRQKSHLMCVLFSLQDLTQD
jgi:hypothetical protein